MRRGEACGGPGPARTQLAAEPLQAQATVVPAVASSTHKENLQCAAPSPARSLATRAAPGGSCRFWPKGVGCSQASMYVMSSSQSVGALGDSPLSTPPPTRGKRVASPYCRDCSPACLQGVAQQPR